MVNDDLQQPTTEETNQEPPLADAMEEKDPALATPEAAAGGESPLASSTSTTARLVVKRSGTETDTEFPVNSPCVIGRFDPSVGPVDIDLGNIPEGAYVSRKHAKISSDGGVWMIEDLGSSNGTFVLGDDFERVEVAQIHDGQEIALGNARFVFHLS